MTKQEYEVIMTDVIRYYGKDKFDPVHLREIYSSFERFDLENFRRVVKIVFRDFSFPPRVAEFIKASESLRKEDSIPKPVTVKALDYEPFFPDEEWIRKQMPMATDGREKADPAYIEKAMRHMAGAMRANHEGMKRMLRNGR